MIGPALRGFVRLTAAGAVAVVLAAPAVAATSDREGFDAETAFARSQSAIGVQLDDHRFVDTRGHDVGLGALRDKPLVLSLVYTSCPDTCSVVTRNLAHAVRAARQALGETSFSVATVGFDSGFDTPEQMRLYADRQGVTMSDWRFLSADPRTLERLLDQLGFSYVTSPRGFDHLAQTSVIDAEGRVYRQIYGDSFAVPSLVEPLKEMALGRPAGLTALGDWIDRVKLLCPSTIPRPGATASTTRFSSRPAWSYCAWAPWACSSCEPGAKARRPGARPESRREARGERMGPGRRRAPRPAVAARGFWREPAMRIARLAMRGGNRP